MLDLSMCGVLDNTLVDWGESDAGAGTLTENSQGVDVDWIGRWC